MKNERKSVNLNGTQSIQFNFIVQIYSWCGYPIELSNLTTAPSAIRHWWLIIAYSYLLLSARSITQRSGGTLSFRTPNQIPVGEPRRFEPPLPWTVSDNHKPSAWDCALFGPPSPKRVPECVRRNSSKCVQKSQKQNTIQILSAKPKY